MKWCPKCQQTKPADEYSRRAGKNAHLLQSYCRPCFNAYCKETDRPRRDPLNTARYGLSKQQYTELYNLREGVCQICRQPETRVKQGKVTRLCVDHDHATGKVRGILCNRCNVILGLAGDDPKILKDAITYLQRELTTIDYTAPAWEILE